MPYVFTNGDLQHLRECPVCGKVIKSAVKDAFVEYMNYEHYDGTACLDTEPVTHSE